MELKYKFFTALNHANRIVKGESIKTKFTKYLNSIEYLPYEQQIDIQAENLLYHTKYVINNIEAYKQYKNHIKLDKRTYLTK